MPLFGSTNLKGFPIKVRVSSDCSREPLTFITVMAHELSHIVLHSLIHPRRNCEIHTDVTAMVLGFSKIMNRGRKIIRTYDHDSVHETQTTTYGYLSDADFDLAARLIAQLLRGYRQEQDAVTHEVKRVEKKVAHVRAQIRCFRKYLDYMDTHLKLKVSREDGYEICKFHQTGYTSPIETLERNVTNQIRQYAASNQNHGSYDKERSKQFQQHRDTIRAIGGQLQTASEALGCGVKVMQRYMPLRIRLRTYFQMRYPR